MTVTSPKTTSVDKSHPAAVVAALRANFRTGATRSFTWRDTQLQAVGRMIAECTDDFVRALGEDLGRDEVDAVMLDLTATKAELKFARKHLREWMHPKQVAAPIGVRPGKAWYQYEPLGVVLVIGPWNYPIHLTLTPLISALAAGNTVVIKPSEITPACSTALVKAISTYFDPDVVAVVEGAADVTQELIDEAVDHCFFTGSPAVGKAVMAACAKHLTPVTLELGGKCPAVVTPSADLEITAKRLAFGKLTNSGQTCVAPDYVLVDRRVKDQFVELLVATIAKFSDGKQVPIVNERNAARLNALIRGAGGRTVLGGTVDLVGAKADPTVIVDPDADASILHEEIFGPVLPIVGVDSLDEALNHINRGTRPLASYLFSNSRKDEERMLGAVNAGGFAVNHVMLHLAVNDLPFGGVGTSGTGRYHGRWGFETFSNPVGVLRKPFRPDPGYLYPPRKPIVQKLLRKVL